MCTYSQLKSNIKKYVFPPPPPGGQCIPLCPKIIHVQRNRYLKMY